ncbi:nitrogenase vanadium-iron cofactor biosynthesis protein VnfN-related oxidoreductase subunit [Geotalea daltonii FRC-32]|uniref:Nitrogenase vanadium-iron cofactor biosynthesis protein VnfN-related oxidoreductase subunit n=1 Tax=Geotalea daltonii (strain DSM 22248 / JCM 15807 / FRC-32) TaxID=316067 RepID=B9M074_GEODF|nr:nitrogenase component 1 [Geotalea daltonii]ACM20854.1 nitrogenase vanadium-iron cofactor biosynthesis protein VnfN-related oxidoreductase subunit [Geotalea daltonii FRC-32]
MTRIIDQPRYVCALGAMQTVQGIYRGVPILHAGPGCAGKLAAGIAGNNGDSGYISPQVYPCTNVSETEIVFGGEENLRQTIDNALKVIDGDFFIVLSGCTTEIVGDDIATVTREFGDRDKPVIFVETAGFKGTNLEGHEWVIDAIIEQYLAKKPPVEKVKGLVNIWGPVPSYDPFWVGNIRELEALVAELGLTPNIIFGEYRGIAEIDRIPAAEYNLLVAPWVGLKNMKSLQEKFGTPYLHYPTLPIGAFETSRFLRAVGEFAGVDPSKVEGIIGRHEREYYYHIERTSDVFLENRTMSRRFSTVTNAADALAISRFLVNDFGLVPDRQYITDGTPAKHRDAIIQLFKEFQYGIEAEVVFSTDGYEIHNDIRNNDYFGAPLIIGSIYEKKLAEELNGNFLAVSVPFKERLVLSSSYVGYRGGLKLLEDIYTYVLKQFN